MNRVEKRRMKAQKRKNKKFRIRVEKRDDKLIANGNDFMKLMNSEMGFLQILELGKKGITHVDMSGVKL